MDKYVVNIWWSADDNCFLASMPELPGCVADGATREEALANVRKIAQEWVDLARQRVRVIPQPAGF